MLTFTNNRPVVAIFARDLIGGIGFQNKLPWGHLSQEMKHFVKATRDNIVIMGRKTFESMGSKPLPKRINIVLTRDKEEYVDDIDAQLWFCENAEQAIKLCNVCADDKTVFIAGGKEIYQLFKEHVTDVLESVILSTYQADTNITGVFNPVDYEVKRNLVYPGFDNEVGFHVIHSKLKNMYSKRLYLRSSTDVQITSVHLYGAHFDINKALYALLALRNSILFDNKPIGLGAAIATVRSMRAMVHVNEELEWDTILKSVFTNIGRNVDSITLSEWYDEYMAAEVKNSFSLK
jgi:dihydrofolate reductase